MTVKSNFGTDVYPLGWGDIRKNLSPDWFGTAGGMPFDTSCAPLQLSVVLFSGPVRLRLNFHFSRVENRTKIDYSLNKFRHCSLAESMQTIAMKEIV